MFWISEERGCVMVQTELGARSWIRVSAFSRSWRFRHAVPRECDFFLSMGERRTRRSRSANFACLKQKCISRHLSARGGIYSQTETLLCLEPVPPSFTY